MALSIIDHAIINFHSLLQAAWGHCNSSTRPSPADGLPENTLTANERRHAAGLMRINHVGEVCAQALYQGQALTARTATVKEKLAKAAQEENDHLSWCQQRVYELSSHTSYLNPFWYTGSLTIGAIAGLIGDKISLGFLAETEHQVEQHLTDHLQKLPATDYKSRRILEQMRIDETQHATMAEQAGAIPLPTSVKLGMRWLSKVMTTTAYWI